MMGMYKSIIATEFKGSILFNYLFFILVNLKFAKYGGNYVRMSISEHGCFLQEISKKKTTEQPFLSQQNIIKLVKKKGKGKLRCSLGLKKNGQSPTH